MIKLEVKTNLRIGDLNRKLLKAVSVAIDRAGQAYVDSVKEYIAKEEPWKTRTGQLLKAIRFYRLDEFSGVVLGESDKAKYGRFLEFGTKGPYIIKPRRQKALKIPTEQGYILRRKVVHPGIKARPWFFRKEHEEKAVKAFEEAVKDELSNS